MGKEVEDTSLALRREVAAFETQEVTQKSASVKGGSSERLPTTVTEEGILKEAAS